MTITDPDRTCETDPEAIVAGSPPADEFPAHKVSVKRAWQMKQSSQVITEDMCSLNGDLTRSDDAVLMAVE